MRALAFGLTALALFTPTLSQAADIDTRPRASSVASYSDGGFYVGRGGNQDSGWAYEVPVYHDLRDCRERIIQTPYGINRLRQCPARIGPVRRVGGIY